MRSFKSKILSACAWVAPVVGAALPSREVARPDGRLLHYGTLHFYKKSTSPSPGTC
jgi:hypothetical protein